MSDERLERLVQALIKRGVISDDDLQEEDIPDDEPAQLMAGNGYLLGERINAGQEDAGRVRGVGFDAHGRMYTAFAYDDGRPSLRMFADDEDFKF